MCVSLKVICDDVIRLSIYAFVLKLNSNIYGLTLLPLQDIRLWNPSDLGFDLSRSLKVKCDGVAGLPIYAFLLIFNSNRWHNSAPLQEIRLWNLSDFEFDLSRSLKVKCDVIRLTIHGFLLRYTAITCLSPFSSHRHSKWNVFSYLLSLSLNHEKLQVHRTPKWPWTLKGQRYPIYVHLLPTTS